VKFINNQMMAGSLLLISPAEGGLLIPDGEETPKEPAGFSLPDSQVNNDAFSGIHEPVPKFLTD
jgi:hypothetical protein